MPVSSYIITTTESRVRKVRASLAKYENVMLSDDPGPKFAVAVSSQDEKSAKAWGEVIDALPGVESFTLVYHNFEDVDQLEPSISHASRMS